jgi:hypothetical protein
MKKYSLMFAVVFTAILMASCGKQADQKADKVQPQGTAEMTQQPVMIDSSAIVAKPVETPTKAVTKTEPESKPIVEKPKPQKKVVPDTRAEVIPPPVVIMIPESTTIKVKLIDSIDSDVHVTGTKFRALLAAPLLVDGKTVYEEGTAVTGVLDNVVESGHLKTPAELSFSLISITDAAGNEIPIKTYTIDEKKGSHTNRDAELIGGGALVGGIIGKLTKKKGGTLIGAAAGAAAGAATAAATGKKDLVHSAGTEVVFILKEPVQVTVKEGPFTRK